MRIVHIRKRGNACTDHFAEGIVVLDNSDKFIGTNFIMPKSFTVNDIYRYLSSMQTSYSRIVFIYGTEVMHYANLLEIPNIFLLNFHH